MAVIPFPNLQPQGPDPRMVWGQRTLTKRQGSPLNGVATTLERPGSVWTASLPYANLLAERRAQLINFAASCRGYASRFYMPLYGWTRRGSFSAPEILPNPYFANGTTGWTSFSQIARTAADGIYRGTRNANTITMAIIHPTPSPTVTQYAPHVWRVLVSGKRYPVSLRADIRNAADTATFGQGAVQTASSFLDSVAFVPYDTTCLPRLIDTSFPGLVAGDYVEVGYASLSRCALVDNAPNLLLQSDEFDATWAATRATVDDQALVGPDGNSTADHIAEDGTAANTHFVSQAVTVSSAAADYAYSCSLKAVNRTWACLRVVESTSSHELLAFVNLSTGAIGTVSVTGANWTNARGFVVAEGNGWYRLTVVGRKASAGTTLTCAVIIAEADSDITFSGLSQNSIGAWRASLAASGVPVRGGLTTTTATTGTLQTGSALYLKGLPASTNGLLLQGDPVEIITNTSSQLVRVRAPLNSDAAGLGYLQFEAPLRISPLDNAGVIVCNPLCRMMLDSPDVSWSEHQQAMTDFEFAAIEDTYP